MSYINHEQLRTCLLTIICLFRTHRLTQYDPKTPMFGMNLILDGVTGGVIHVGDTVIA